MGFRQFIVFFWFHSQFYRLYVAKFIKDHVGKP